MADYRCGCTIYTGVCPVGKQLNQKCTACYHALIESRGETDAIRAERWQAYEEAVKAFHAHTEEQRLKMINMEKTKQLRLF